MLFTQPFPIFYSIGLVVGLSIFIFGYKYYAFRKIEVSQLYKLPSIIVTGPKFSGKTMLIKSITKNKLIPHPFEEDFLISRITNENGTLQFIEIPYMPKVDLKILERFKRLNLKYGIFLFDVGPNSSPIEEQIEIYKKTKTFFSNLPFAVVANKVDVSEENKLNYLKKNFDKVYEISLLKGTYLDKKEKTMLIEELESLSRLIAGIDKEEYFTSKEIRY